MKPEILIEEIYSTGARLMIDGPDLVIESKGGPLAEYLLEELRRHKPEVISTLRKGQTGQPLEAGEYPDIILGKERYQCNFVGQRVSFLLKGSVELCLPTDGTEFAQGTILSQKWLGYTARGKIPEYQVQIATDDGQVYTRRMVEDYVS